MTISRRAFLIATTAFTAINLYFPAASAPIDADHLQGTHWRQVWFGEADSGNPAGMERFSLTIVPSLTFSDHDRWKLRHARPGMRPADQTVHFFGEIDEYIPPENIGMKEMLTALKDRNPELNQQIQEAFTEGSGDTTVIEHYATMVSKAYGIDNAHKPLGKAFWAELEQAIRST